MTKLLKDLVVIKSRRVVVEVVHMDVIQDVQIECAAQCHQCACLHVLQVLIAAKTCASFASRKVWQHRTCRHGDTGGKHLRHRNHVR